MKPLRIGWEAARVNVCPMAFLWLIAIVLSVADLNIPSIPVALEPLRRWQDRCGWPAAAFSAAFFCGIVPRAFQVSVRALRPPRPALVIAAQTALSAVNGILCWNFYRYQVKCFGADASISTLAVKTVVDQFVWTPLIVAPLNAACYFINWVAD